MKQMYRKSPRFVIFVLGLLAIIFNLNTSIVLGQTSIPDDNMTIFYRLDKDEPLTNCGSYNSMSLGEFIKRTLSWEIMEGEDNWSVEALRANAIAARTFTISSYKSEEYIYPVDGQSYHCTNAWEQDGFLFRVDDDFNDLETEFPNIFQAVDDTEGIILTHPQAVNRELTTEPWPVHMRFGAIEASYKRETGVYTLDIENRPWLKNIYDPISFGTDFTGSNSGMGQKGAMRWAEGQDVLGNAFPKWDYRRILAHYYSEVQFTNIIPTPPDNYRANIMQVQGIPIDGSLTICPGAADRTGILLNYQNTGRNTVSCSGNQTFIGYHLYKGDGSALACTGCTGVRKIAACDNSDGLIQPGDNLFLPGFRVFVPNSGSFIDNQTYLLRFDLEQNGVWQGLTTNFAWPPQDIPITICDTNPGGGGIASIITSYPPGVVSSVDLVNGEYGFSWEGVNGSGGYTFDVEYRNADILNPNGYPSTFDSLFQSTPATHLSASVNCDRDRKDWQFRVKAHSNGEESDWTYVESRTMVYPHPWPTKLGITILEDINDPETSWADSLAMINLGGGTFTWSASANQSWIQVNSSGQDFETLGVVITEPPGGIGVYQGNITINITNWSPTTYCNLDGGGNPVTTFTIPVTVIIDDLDYIYLPLMLKAN